MDINTQEMNRYDFIKAAIGLILFSRCTASKDAKFRTARSEDLNKHIRDVLQEPLALPVAEMEQLERKIAREGLR